MYRYVFTATVLPQNITILLYLFYTYVWLNNSIIVITYIYNHSESHLDNPQFKSLY